jgi:hypothetical protein
VAMSEPSTYRDPTAMVNETSSSEPGPHLQRGAPGGCE